MHNIALFVYPKLAEIRNVISSRTTIPRHSDKLVHYFQKYNIPSTNCLRSDQSWIVNEQLIKKNHIIWTTLMEYIEQTLCQLVIYHA